MNTSFRSCAWILASVLIASCESGEAPSTGTPAGSVEKKAPEVRATRIEVAELQTTRSTRRFVRPGEVVGAREAKLASALGGFVERVLVETGARVEKNGPIAYIDTRTHRAQVRLTRVELDEAKRELERLEKLGKAVPSARVDAARSRLARAEAQHQLSLTRSSQAVIKAPFSGVVVDLELEQGEVVAPGAPIARLIQLDPIHVSVSVTDRDVGSLAIGGEARVSTSATADPQAGEIVRIEPAADLQTRTFLVEVAVPNAERRLLPGMIAQVEFRTERAGEALFLPQEFLVTRLDGNGVFVADGKVARWRPVELGAIAGTDVEIARGLEAGERIVVLGHRALNDGDPIIVARAGRCCEGGRVVFGSQKTGGAEKEKKENEGSEPEAKAKAAEPGAAR